jgi:hypothetical protein
MAYRRPGVIVTQQFANLAPALAVFSLPSVAVGPAYQLVSQDSLGAYAAAATTYTYASLLGGALVDFALADPNDPFPATKLPIKVTLKNTVVQIVPGGTVGAGNGTAFSDVTSGQFADVLAGDLLVISQTASAPIISAQTNGKSFMAAGQTSRLQAGVSGQFANVQAGDVVTVTGVSPAIAGSFTVLAKAPNDILLLSGPVNDGSADSVAVHYSIAGVRGATNAGTYTVKSVTDANNLVLTSDLPQPVEAPLAYVINRKIGSTVLTQLPIPMGNGYTADGAGIYLPASLSVTIGLNDYPIVSGNVFADYRALRTDLAANVFSISTVDDITAQFGANQISPANPLAYGLYIMKQNTVTAVNGLGLDANAVTDETLSFTNAADVLGLTKMYAIAVLSQTPTVHELFKTHVDQYSLPTPATAGLERVCLINSKLITRAVLQAESTTVTTLAQSSVVVNTQLDGVAAFATPTHLNDPQSNIFANVQTGDSVVIQAGTNAIAGTYSVVSKTDSNNIVLSGSIISSGTATNFQYYIVRKDGLGADGVTFHDRNALFITNGAAPGMFLNVLGGSYPGRYSIAAVASETTLTIAPAIPGVVSLQTAIDYQIDRDLSKDEQAALIAGYSSAYADRRVVHLWPDVLQVPSGQTLVDAPGYYACCAIAALTTGLPTQQGFTNLTVSGFLGLKNSSFYFTPAQLDVIAGGGSMVMAQDGPQQALYVRHELTTDLSSIKFQEYMVTKNVDFIAKFIKNAYAPFIGPYNIVDSTLDTLKTTGSSVTGFLKNKTILPRIGGVIRSGSLSSIAEDATQIDTVDLTFTLNIPIPLNNLDITVSV